MHSLKNNSFSIDIQKPLPRFKSKQIDMMNLQSNLQAVLIGLLSKFCIINVGRPHRKSVLTQQFIKIKSLQFTNDDEIDIPTFIQRRSEEKILNEFVNGNTSKKTAKRRVQPTKRLELMKLLQDLLSEFDITVYTEEEDANGYQGKVYIYHKSTLLFDTKDVTLKGTQINESVTELLSTTKQVYITSTSFSSIL
ncbi:TATA-binding protein-associated phosphoprotein [Entamoeba marina]